MLFCAFHHSSHMADACRFAVPPQGKRSATKKEDQGKLEESAGRQKETTRSQREPKEDRREGRRVDANDPTWCSPVSTPIGAMDNISYFSVPRQMFLCCLSHRSDSWRMHVVLLITSENEDEGSHKGSRKCLRVSKQFIIGVLQINFIKGGEGSHNPSQRFFAHFHGTYVGDLSSRRKTKGATTPTDAHFVRSPTSLSASSPLSENEGARKTKPPKEGPQGAKLEAPHGAAKGNQKGSPK